MECWNIFFIEYKWDADLVDYKGFYKKKPR